MLHNDGGGSIIFEPFIGTLPDDNWETAYETLFDQQYVLPLLRRYRDAVLATVPKGKLYTDLLYNSSQEALDVLLTNPALMWEAKALIKANKDEVSQVLKGNATKNSSRKYPKVPIGV